MDFLERLKEYIELREYTPQTILIGSHDNKDSVAIRPTPGAIDERYMEAGKIYDFNFQVLCHSRNNLLGYETINKLTSDFENLRANDIISETDTFTLVTMSCQTTPNYVEETNHGVLWTAIFTAELYIRGGKFDV